MIVMVFFFFFLSLLERLIHPFQQQEQEGTMLKRRTQPTKASDESIFPVLVLR